MFTNISDRKSYQLFMDRERKQVHALQDQVCAAVAAGASTGTIDALLRELDRATLRVRTNNGAINSKRSVA